MFKRVSDSIRSMLASNTDHSHQIAALTAMGFDETRARQALAATSGNINQATDILLMEQQVENDPDVSIVAVNSPNHANNLAGKAAMERAQQQASKRSVGSNGRVITQRSNPLSLSSKTTTRKAAESHHELQLPTPIRQLTKQEQILRCAQRLAPHSLTVDTFLKLCKNIREHPHKEVYRTLYKSHPEYQRVMKDKPGVEDLLLAVNFYSTTHNGSEAFVLARSMIDPALLFMATSALEKVREESEEYKVSKAQYVFVKEIQALLDIADGSEQEALKRAEYLSKCPTESLGSGLLLQIHLGPDHTISRKFDSDDTLRDIIHWLGAHSSAIPQKLASRDWSLVSLNSFPVEPIDTVQAADKTLQSIGCFPSARLEIRPSSLPWKQGLTNSIYETSWSTRALGNTTTME